VIGAADEVFIGINFTSTDCCSADKQSLTL